MLKWLALSLGLHAFWVAVYFGVVLGGKALRNDPSQSAVLPTGVVSIDYMPVVKTAVQAARRATPVIEKSKPVALEQGPSEKPSLDVANSTEAADSAVTIIGEPGQPALTLEQYVRWVRTHNVAVEYPRMARIRGDQGRVVIEVTVPASGNALENIRVSGSSGSGLLDDAALETAKHWRYPPFQGAERVTISIAFKFVLED